ncbi:hypothetical protein N0V90_011980 [Kalmusia sp. IMI 367209]|nr:hypothetical protein N0V90_011980 [Kalmusia sp. IMI 367209]
MSQLTTEAKGAIKANLELELKARSEKLSAMCEAQVASLRSRLERRVNRIPNSKRSMSITELLDVPITVPVKAPKLPPAKKEVAAAATQAPVPVRTTVQPAARKTRVAPSKPAPKPAPKTTRGKKRPSDDGDKENEELNVPKKRAKATTKPAPPAPRTTSTKYSCRF